MKSRNIVIVVVVIVALALLLWGAWRLDLPSKTQSKQQGQTEFSYALPEEPDNTHNDIMIYCSEDIMGAPSEAFAKWLKLEGIPLKFPGGPMAIARLNDVTVSNDLEPAKRVAIEILKRYSPRRVVLVAHTKCIYYDAVAAWKDDLAGVRERQIRDTKAAIQILRKWFPRAEVTGYIAEEENRRLFFRPVR